MVRIFLAAQLLSFAFCSWAHAQTSLKTTEISLDALGHAAQPSLAVDRNRSIFILSWQSRLKDGCTALKTAELSITGKLGPAREAARGCNWFVNWADFPSLVVADNGDWITHWLEKTSGSTYAYEIRLVRSRDRGKTWSTPIVVHDDATDTEHGFVAMAPLVNDQVLIAWLDGRQMMSANAGTDHSNHSAHKEHAHAGMSLRSAIIDRDGKISEARLADASVCSCCGNDLVRTKNGGHWLVFRDNDDNLRDFGLQRRTANQWHTPTKLHADGWKVEGCPVNGAALATQNNQVLAVWPTMGTGTQLEVRAKLLGEPKSQIAPNASDKDSSQVARSALDKNAFLRLDAGDSVLGRPDLTAFSNGWLVSLLGNSTKAGNTALKLIWLDSKLQLRSELNLRELEAGRNIGMPRIAAIGKIAMLVWTQTATKTSTASQNETVLQLMRIGQ
jgi:hypothetical protein